MCTWQTLGIPVIPLMLPDPTAVHQFQSLQVRKADFKYQRTLDTTPAPMFCSAPASAMMVRETSQPSTCDTHSQPSWVLGCCTLSQQCIAGSHNATCKPNLQRLLRPQRAHGAPLAEWPLLHSGRALTASMASRWACLHDGPLVVVAPLQAGHLLLHHTDASPAASAPPPSASGSARPERQHQRKSWPCRPIITIESRGVAHERLSHPSTWL